MINIVFLLLVFFMLTATIAPPPPLDVAPPRAEGRPAAADAEAPLHVDAAGRLAQGAHRDAAVWPALAAAPPERLVVVADAALEAAALARLLARLAEVGVAEVSLRLEAP